MEVTTLYQKQKTFFNTQATLDVSFRRAALKKLQVVIQKKEDAILEALFQDLKKSGYESYLTEVFIVKSEIKKVLNKLSIWTKTQRVPGSILNYPTQDYLIPEPYGCTLHISPWNYPFQLAVTTVIGAVAAGNTAVLKPSEYAPHTALVVEEIMTEAFAPEHVLVVQGGAETSTELLKLRWDYIIFTGSTPVGKIIAKAAAEHLTPFTLELGGKSPCIVDETAPIKLSAKRIVWGKYVNCGQTCIAPDYILVHHSKAEALTEALIHEIKQAFGDNPQESFSYGRIINKKHLLHLTNMLKGITIAHGGTVNEENLYLEPTIISQPGLDSEVMKKEIFGPLLPIISYTNEEELKPIINRYEKPLGFYVFTKRNAFIKKVQRDYSFGGGVSNDSIIQFANDNLPFGGIGHSGVGAYHGKFSFETFTHYKPFIKKARWLDLPTRYAPYPKKFKVLKKLLGMM